MMEVVTATAAAAVVAATIAIDWSFPDYTGSPSNSNSINISIRKRTQKTSNHYHGAVTSTTPNRNGKNYIYIIVKKL